MKKIILYLFISIMLLSINSAINAYNLTINSNTSTTVGKNVAVTVTASGLTGRTIISSSNSSVLNGYCDEWLENSSYTCQFIANSSGTASIIATIMNPSDDDGNDLTDITRSIKITVNNKNTPSAIDVNKTYSKNNYLKSLNIEGYDLTPAFNKDTLEYSVTLNPGTENINVIATKEDGEASVKGSGEVNISEGINTINIIVTAENGNERTYVIKATVEEKDPIEVKVNNKKYRVVKKKELIGSKDGYTETTVNINNFDIPALYNEVTKVTLVGLKDEEGNIKLFAYNTSIGEYKEYKEFTFDLINLYIHEKKNSKYKKITIKINDEEVSAYKLEGIEDYYLLYATNTTTGYEGYYLYDAKENSVQRYDTTLLENISNEKDKYLNIVIVLSCVCFLSMLFLLIEVNRDSKRKNEE